MKIVLSANTSWYLFNFRAGLIERLIKQNHQVVVIAPNEDYRNKLEQLGCCFERVDLKTRGTNLLKEMLVIQRYRMLFKRIRPDVVLNFTVKPVIYGSLAARSLNLTHINTITGLGSSFIYGGMMKWLVMFLYKISLGRSKVVFFQNNDDLNVFKRYKLVRELKVSLVPGSGVNLTKFKYQPPPRNEQFEFLLIARLLYDKGIQEYVDAARMVLKQHRAVTFNLLGPIEVCHHSSAIPYPILEKWIDEGVIKYLGEVEDVRPYLVATDCLVLPSYREGLSRTLLEAGAIGRPVIASDVPGCKSLITDGDNGYLCLSRNARQLADVMLKLMSLDIGARAQMGLKNRMIIEKGYGEDIVVDHYLDALT